VSHYCGLNRGEWWVTQVRKMSARTRWAVPAGVVATIGVIAGATAVANAAQPSLPSQSVAQLLADLQQASARPQGPLTATIQETANLGLPALSQIGAITGQSGQLGPLSALAGTTTVSIWYLNQDHLRIARQLQAGESDLRVDGNQVWLWDSKTQTATHVLLPRDIGNEARTTQQLTKTPIVSGWTNPASTLTPLAAARQALAQVGPSTRVTLGPNVSVAGRAAYQISVSPKTSGSLVSQILIAIDAARHIPLRVEVIARDSSSPAFEVGYTALTFGPPAMSNFTFTPPPGAQVNTETVPAGPPAGLKASLGLHGLGLGGLGLGGLGLGVLGPGLAGIGSSTSFGIHATPTPCNNSTCYVPAPQPVPGQPALPKSALKQIEAAFVAHLPKSLTKAQRAAAIKSMEQNLTAGLKAQPDNGGVFLKIRPVKLKAHSLGIIRMSGTPLPAAGAGSPKVLGKYWTSVIATPANPEVAAMVQRLLTSARQGQAQGGGFFVGSSSQEAPGSAGPAPGPIPVGQYLAVLRALLAASTPVHGSWGSGRLIQSALLSVLVTSKGQILAGVVTPSVLYADAASLSK
jgi:outer membrane lipoprotein-sorting protein